MSGREGGACQYIKDEGDQLGGFVLFDKAGRIFFDRHETMSTASYNNSECHYFGGWDFDNNREESKQYCANYLGEYDQFENTVKVIKSVRFCDRECLHDGALFFPCPWDFHHGYGFHWVAYMDLPGETAGSFHEGFHYVGSYIPSDGRHRKSYWYVPDSWRNNTEIMATANNIASRYLFNLQGLLIHNYTNADQIIPSELSRPPHDPRVLYKRFPPVDQLEQCTEAEQELIKTFDNEQPASLYIPPSRSGRSVPSEEKEQESGQDTEAATRSRTIKLAEGEYRFNGSYIFDHQGDVNFEPAQMGTEVTIIIDDPDADSVNLSGVVRLINTRFNFRDIRLIFRDTRSLVLTNKSEFTVHNGTLEFDPSNYSGNTLVMVSDSHFRISDSDVQNKMETEGGENPVTLDIHARANISQSTLSSITGGIFTLDKNARLTADHSTFISESGGQPEVTDSLRLVCHHSPWVFDYPGSWSPQFELLNVSLSGGEMTFAFRCGRRGVTPEAVNQNNGQATTADSEPPTSGFSNEFDSGKHLSIAVGIVGGVVVTTGAVMIFVAACKRNSQVRTEANF